jgi:hypothetical protein
LVLSGEKRTLNEVRKERKEVVGVAPTKRPFTFYHLFFVISKKLRNFAA